MSWKAKPRARAGSRAAGLVARGLPGWEAACWGVWLHGEAGRRLSERMGSMGFLARELPGEIPALMRGV